MEYFESPLVKRLLAWLNLLLFVGTLLFNYSSNFQDNITEQSQKYRMTLEPAPFSFAIWGIIYAFNFAYVLREAFFSSTDTNILNSGKASAVSFNNGTMRFLFALSCVLNVGWVYLYLSDYVVLSTIDLLLLWAVIHILYFHYSSRIRPLIQLSPMAYSAQSQSWGNVLFREIPFALYYGWTCLALMLSITGTLEFLGFPTRLWPSIAILALVIVFFMIITLWQSDLIFGLVGSWGVFGIIMRQVQRMAVYTTYEQELEHYRDEISAIIPHLPNMNGGNETTTKAPEEHDPLLSDPFASFAGQLYIAAIMGFLILNIFYLVLIGLSICRPSKKTTHLSSEPASERILGSSLPLYGSTSCTTTTTVAAE